MADLGFSGSQLGYAERIIGVGKGRGMSEKDILTALMVALAESEIQNLANNSVPESLGIPHDGIGGDSDSVGIFQQRPSQGWGTAAECMNPEVSAGKFYAALAKLPNRDAVPAAINAQRVQHSFDPSGSNYLVRQLPAQKIMDSLYSGATISRASNVTQNAGDNPIIAVAKMTTWITNPANLHRILTFIAGGILVVAVLVMILKDSPIGHTAVGIATKGLIK
jgi:hypothetical protein